MRPTLFCTFFVLAAVLAGCDSDEPAREPTPEPAPPPEKAEPEPEPAEDTGRVIPETNHPPEVTAIELLPEEPTAFDDLRLDLQVKDPDRDVVNVSRSWYLDGEKLNAENGRTLPHHRFDKGDKVAVEVVLDDGKTQVTVTSPEVTIRNSPPEVLSSPADLSEIDGFTVRARDPDGDPLTWRLEGAPRGLSIDSGTGRLSYQGSTEDPGGRYQVKIVIEDDDGGYAHWTFGMTVQPGSEAVRKKEQEERQEALEESG